VPDPGPRALAAPDTVLGRAAVVAGLAGVAITQPVLDLFGRNPEFFVSGRYTKSQIVLFALIVALVPSAVGAGVVALASRVNARTGEVAYAVTTACLSVVLVAGILRVAGVSRLWVVVAVASMAGLLVVIAERSLVPVRLFLRYLALSNLFFLGVMLLASPTARLLATPSFDPGFTTIPDVPGPVVVLVLDELPISTLMTREGEIDGSRYPGFAELAARSTWFRNASSLSEMTPQAVPDLLTGRRAGEDDLPTSLDHSRNLLSLLGRDLPLRRYEVATDLCPLEVCDPLPPQPIRQAVRDAVVVFGHRVLPATLREDLPAIDHSWGGFGAVSGAVPARTQVKEVYDVFNSLDLAERSPGGQVERLREEIAAIDGAPALHVVHVLAPHDPWLLTPWGGENVDLPTLVEDEDDPAYGWSALQHYQAHALQAGAVDAAIGDLVGHLDALGAWDSTTLVVAADHGRSFFPPDLGRDITDRNIEEVLRIPLFVKAPGQQTGEVRDDVALSIDVLPTIIDLLGIETNWRFEGRSLFDGPPATVEPLVSSSVDAAIELAERRAQDFPREGWLGLAAIGSHAELLGRPITSFEVGRRSGLAWSLDRREMLDAIVPRSFAPQFLSGSVHAGSRPPELVVAVDGRVAAVTGGYVQEGSEWRFLALIGHELREGSNDVRAYEVAEADEGLVLRPVRMRR
jgi:hypothetical protein